MNSQSILLRDYIPTRANYVLVNENRKEEGMRWRLGMAAKRDLAALGPLLLSGRCSGG